MNGGYVAIVPAAPTADDVVQITAAAGGFGVYDDPESVVVERRDNIFTFVLPAPDLVLLPPPPQCVPKIAGPLAVGTYRVDVSSRSYDSGIVTSHTSKQFTVAPSSPVPSVAILPAAPTECDAVRVRIMVVNVWSATQTVVGNASRSSWDTHRLGTALDGARCLSDACSKARTTSPWH